MIKPGNISIILLAGLTLYLSDTGIENTAYAVQPNINKAPLNGQQKIYGRVIQVIDTGRFTFLEVETHSGSTWAAGPVAPVTKGDMVAFSANMPMKNFHSKALERDFNVIYFVDRYLTGSETSASTSPYDQSKQQTGNTVITAMAATPAAVRAGGLLPGVELDGLNVQTKTLSDFRGKPLLINIWASWCGPCRAEMGSLQRLARRYDKKEFNVIGISTDDERNRATAFIQQTEITFENFFDHDLYLESLLGADMIPLTVLVDAEGRVLLKVRGSREWDSPQTISAIGEVFHVSLPH